MNHIIARVFKESGIELSVLAKLFGVSRPTVYEWRKKGTCNAECEVIFMALNEAIDARRLPLKGIPPKEKLSILRRITRHDEKGNN